MTLWMVRADGGERVPLFLEENIIGLGWCKIDVDLTGKDKLFIKNKFEIAYPQDTKSTINAWVGFFHNFIHVMKINDHVLTYDPVARVYYLGKITSNYKYNTKFETTPHIREIEWFKNTISRDSLSVETKNSLGSANTLFKLTEEQKKEVLDLSSKTGVEPNLEEKEVIEEKNKSFSQTLLENAKENLKDTIQQLSYDDMEELVKEILNAMGYVAKRSKKGSDRGVDVFASTDGLGLEEPRIFVEVKHRAKQTSAPEIRSFLGGRKLGDKCLYINTGGFAKDAKYEAERSSIALTILDIEDLAGIISLYYDKFSVEGRALLPLKKVYIPFNYKSTQNVSFHQ